MYVKKKKVMTVFSPQVKEYIVYLFAVGDRTVAII